MFQIANVLQPLIDACDAILQFWHGVVGSWGTAIVLLTFTVRLAILPLTFTSVRSMQKLQVLQPEIKKIQARFKEDKQRMNQEMMKFYQENKVNPLGSCLPLILQIPFFISLFYLLKSPTFKADIEGAESFLFIPNLAEPLTGHPFVLGVMIVLYVGTQLVASLITSIGGDKNQRRLMLALPFVFVLFVINFRAGLLVYWITTNVWTIGQQLVVRKLYPKPALVGAPDDDDEAPAPARGKPAPAAPATAPEVAGGVMGFLRSAARGGADTAKAGGGRSGAAKPDAKGSAPKQTTAKGSTAKRATGKGSAPKGSARGSGDGSGGNGASKAPPSAPRKKKKRSGRRR